MRCAILAILCAAVSGLSATSECCGDQRVERVSKGSSPQSGGVFFVEQLSQLFRPALDDTNAGTIVDNCSTTCPSNNSGSALGRNSEDLHYRYPPQKHVPDSKKPVKRSGQYWSHYFLLDVF